MSSQFSDFLFTYGIAFAIFFLISVVITRLVFSIPAILRHQRAQTKILILMADKAGVNPKFLQSVADQVNDRIFPSDEKDVPYQFGEPEETKKPA